MATMEVGPEQSQKSVPFCDDPPQIIAGQTSPPSPLSINGEGENTKKRFCSSQNSPSLVSIILPLHKTSEICWPMELIDQSVHSVIHQWCDQWELILLYDPESDGFNGMDGGDGPSEMDEVDGGNGTKLSRWNDDDRVVRFPISSNQKPETTLTMALDHASGDFVTFLYPADTLSPNAVSECLTLLASRPDTHVMYSDEDWISHDNVRMNPFFKPDWSPDLLVAFPGYPGGMALFRKSVLQKAGEFTEGCAACAPYDGMLRVVDELSSVSPSSSELHPPILHLPKVLYHRRLLHPISTGDDRSNISFHNALWMGRDYMDAVQKAVTASLGRRGRGEFLKNGLTATSFQITGPLNSKSKISIIIPFRDSAEVLETAIQSIIQRSSYTHYEMICVDNQSAHPETFSLMERLDAMPEVMLIHDDSPFNFSALNNRAVKHATGEVLLFLNSDVEVISENWLEAMLIHACREAVGAVGGTSSLCQRYPSAWRDRPWGGRAGRSCV